MIPGATSICILISLSENLKSMKLLSRLDWLWGLYLFDKSIELPYFLNTKR